jgi:hypothetical protein
MSYILLILLIISLIINVLLFKLFTINLTKVEIYEAWILEYKNQINETYQALKFVDDKQIFEKDDEVGFVFSDILEIIKDLKTKIYDEEEKNTQKK